MAVEKMKMMNLAMLKKDAHDVLEEIVLDGSFHITNSSNSPNFSAIFCAHAAICRTISLRF